MDLCRLCSVGRIVIPVDNPRYTDILNQEVLLKLIILLEYIHLHSLNICFLKALIMSYLVHIPRNRFLDILPRSYSPSHDLCLYRPRLVHRDCVWHMGVDMHYLYKLQSRDSLRFECNQLSKRKIFI